MNQKKPHVVLHTGFPPIDNITGLPIEINKSAGIAFSPNPSKGQKVDMYGGMGEETWWDRLFPNRHVHLQAVQVPVIGQSDHPNVDSIISICASTGGLFASYAQYPNTKHCIVSPVIQSEWEEESAFSLLEWVPESPIVLKKASVYWLIIQTPQDSFKWVYSQTNGDSTDELGVAMETESGWVLRADNDPIPSAMIMVQDHQ
ncbi:hypothetical protein BDB01DRAFT_732041 [Pilobolus umbonatus]|nr:hypothetical protein BDB01DRAFT_732041 [Pilobolus umbonatus]